VCGVLAASNSEIDISGVVSPTASLMVHGGSSVRVMPGPSNSDKQRNGTHVVRPSVHHDDASRLHELADNAAARASAAATQACIDLLESADAEAWCGGISKPWYSPIDADTRPDKPTEISAASL